MSTPVEGFPGPGERIGPYEIVRQLGMGGMGVVFEAVDTVLQRRVALKVISPYLANDRAFRVRFTQEAQAMASLDSPHVVQVFAHGEADGSLYIASQLIPDGDLGAMIRAQGAPPPRIALDILAQIATGLADAHAIGLVHRDIKPANVLLRIRGEHVSAYLADFGIARRTDIDPVLSQTLTTQGFAVGTPTYMAPELHTGGTPGTTTDVYSLGCLLWAALTGRAPYTATTDYQLVQAHVEGPIPQLASGGPWEREVNRVLRTALAKHPSGRYPSAAALRDDLRRVLHAFPAPLSVQQGTGHETPDRATVPPGTAAPAPAAPVFAPYVAPAAPRTTPSGSRPSLLVGAALALVALLVIGIVGAVALANGDDDGGGGADPTRSAGTAATPATSDPGTGGTTSPTATPPTDTTPTDTTPTGRGGGGLSEEERRAADNIADALRSDANFSGIEADCTARKLVEQSGVDGLQDKGVLDDDLNFIADTNPAVNPEIFTEIITVSIGCVFESVSFDVTPNP